MTIVKNDGADGFVRRPPKEIRLFLSHGFDEGLIHERAKTLVASILAGDADPLRLTRMDGDAVAADPGSLADEAYAISMFGGSRAIWIEAQSRDLVPALAPLFDRPPPDCSIVVEAGYLKKGAALRVAFENAVNAASIECYPDEKKALVGLRRRGPRRRRRRRGRSGGARRAARDLPARPSRPPVEPSRSAANRRDSIDPGYNKAIRGGAPALPAAARTSSRRPRVCARWGPFGRRRSTTWRDSMEVGRDRAYTPRPCAGEAGRAR